MSTGGARAWQDGQRQIKCEHEPGRDGSPKRPMNVVINREDDWQGIVTNDQYGEPGCVVRMYMVERFVTRVAQVDLFQLGCKQLAILAGGGETSLSAPHGDSGAWPRLETSCFQALKRDIPNRQPD